jgi:4-hydroxybenzoate polyprenyltransferase
MKLFYAFLKLIRFPNLLFIALTQCLFYFFVISPQFSRYPEEAALLDRTSFALLVFASVLIAAGGYIINDYFDLNIDKINRPGSFVIERVIKRRWAMAWHIIFSLAGLVVSFYVGSRIGNPMLGILNALAVLLLWFYSTTFKRQLLVGNIVISLLTAWVVLVIYVCETRVNFARLPPGHLAFIKFVFKAAVIYGGFAFIISLIREVVKDMEDIEGDARYQCKTMPIVWGIPATKLFVSVWMIVLAGALLIFFVYALQVGWWVMAGYVLLMVLMPVIVAFRKLLAAGNSAEYRKVSTLIKGIMLLGILSMIFFNWYN